MQRLAVSLVPGNTLCRNMRVPNCIGIPSALEATLVYMGTSLIPWPKSQSGHNLLSRSPHVCASTLSHGLALIGLYNTETMGIVHYTRQVTKPTRLFITLHFVKQDCRWVGSYLVRHWGVVGVIKTLQWVKNCTGKLKAKSYVCDYILYHLEQFRCNLEGQ